ncbi:hypothetical protein M0M45_19265, partial [Salinispora arenicola]|nr:hypothetical protein [Salinispora arenicola]
MAKKLLGKVVAGAALGGASLLVCTPGIAVADDHHRKDEGKVFAKPHAVEAGHEVKLLEICPKPQEHAYVWSKVTGKVDLKPAHDRRDGKGYRDMGGRDYKRDHKGEDYKRDHKGGRDGSDAEGREHHDYKRDHKGGYGDSQAEGRGWGDESHSGYGQAEGRGWGDDKRDHKGDWGADDAEGREHHDYKRDHKG